MNRIQVVLEGHFDKERPSSRQIAFTWLTEKYRISGAKITGHNDHAATDCPGRHLKKLLPELRKSAAH